MRAARRQVAAELGHLQEVLHDLEVERLEEFRRSVQHYSEEDPLLENLWHGTFLVASASVVPEPLSARFIGSAFVGIVVAAMRRGRKRRA